jgi:hypothetical protein
VLRATGRFTTTGALFDGGPDAWVADLDAVERLGVGHVVLQLEHGVGVDETLTAFSRLAGQVTGSPAPRGRSATAGRPTRGRDSPVTPASNP